MGVRSYVIEELRKLGAHVSTVVAGKVRGRLEGCEEGRPTVMIGSHSDSVLCGDFYDGVAGLWRPWK